MNDYEVKAGMVFIAGKTVRSMPERFKVVCIPRKALYKCSALPFYLNGGMNLRLPGKTISEDVLSCALQLEVGQEYGHQSDSDVLHPTDLHWNRLSSALRDYRFLD